MNEVPGMHADVKSCDVTIQAGAVEAAYACSLPHIQVTAKFGSMMNQGFEAIGKLARIVMMRPFLDSLLATVNENIEVAIGQRDLAVVPALARNSRLTTSSFIDVAAGRDAIAQIVSAYGDAISQPFAARLVGNLTKAYDGFSRATIRKTWLRLGPIALAGAAFIAYGVCAGLPGLSWMSVANNADDRGFGAIAEGLVPVFLVAFVAGRRGRRATKAILGSHAKRAPRQGGWLAAGFGLSLAAAIVGQQAATTSTMSAQGTPLLRQQEARQAATPVPLSRSPFPTRTRPPLQPSVTGPAAVLQTQRGLQELGFYHGPVDGRMSRDVGQSMERLLALVPQDQTWRLRSLGDSGMVQAVMRDEIRLGHLPTDGFVTARLSNFTRANISREDMTKVLGAASRAASHPGTEVRWSSTDGQRGVRAIASRAGPGCFMFDVEIRVRGAVEATGPEKACGPVNTTTWSQP